MITWYKEYTSLKNLCVDNEAICPQLAANGLCNTITMVASLNINQACQRSCGVCGK